MHPYEIIDVFTDTPLQGNPLAVFTEAEQLPSRMMQAVARELNLSETVFLMPGDSECDAHMRIFTPTAELPFAGHPVLGTAFVVGARDRLETVRLRTGAGIVPVRVTRDEAGEIVHGEMDQPIPAVVPFGETARLFEALGIEAAALAVEAYTNGPSHVLVALEDPEAVAALKPDHTALARFGAVGISCFAPTAPARAKTRMFGAGLGVLEDPATGSAAGPIAVHLLRHGRLESGTTLELHQGAEIGRPSTLLATVIGDRDRITRVSVGGSAVSVGHAHLRLG